MDWTMLGLAALGTAVIVLWRHGWQGSRFTVLLMLAGGVGLVAGGGLVGQWIRSGGEWVGSLAETGTSQAFGIGVPALVALFGAVWVAVDLKDRRIHPATPWIAVALPTLVVATGAAAWATDLIGGSGVVG